MNYELAWTAIRAAFVASLTLSLYMLGANHCHFGIAASANKIKKWSK